MDERAMSNFWCATLLGFLTFIPHFGYSQFFHHATLGDVSESGRSFVLERGMVEGLRPGQRARFFLDESQMQSFGVAEVIKVNDGYSYWYFREMPVEFKPKSDLKVFFSLEDDIMSGRRDLKIVQTKGVRARDRKSKVNDRNPPQDLIVRKDDYVEGESVVKTRSTVDYDAQTIDETEFSQGEISLLSSDYPGELESVRPVDEPLLDDTTMLRDQDKALVAKSVTNGTVEKARKAKQRKSEGSVNGVLRREEDLNSSIPNEFDRYQDKLLAEKKLADETRARVLKNGDMWSAGLTDKELRRTLVESGVMEERERRRKAAANLASHHINLRYSTAVSPRTSEIDPNNTGNNFGLAFGYEYLLEHASERYANWSIEGVVERGISYENVGGVGINGRIAWGALGFQVHWFPIYKPTAIRAFIPFVGGGIKRGNGDLQSAFLKNSYDVQMLGTELHAGLRFRFRAGDEVENSAPFGMGFFVMMSLEQNRFNTTTGLNDDIDSVYDITEQRYAFGISAFF